MWEHVACCSQKCLRLPSEIGQAADCSQCCAARCPAGQSASLWSRGAKRAPIIGMLKQECNSACEVLTAGALPLATVPAACRLSGPSLRQPVADICVGTPPSPGLPSAAPRARHAHQCPRSPDCPLHSTILMVAAAAQTAAHCLALIDSHLLAFIDWPGNVRLALSACMQFVLMGGLQAAVQAPWRFSTRPAVREPVHMLVGMPACTLQTAQLKGEMPPHPCALHAAAVQAVMADDLICLSGTAACIHLPSCNAGQAGSASPAPAAVAHACH